MDATNDRFGPMAVVLGFCLLFGLNSSQGQGLSLDSIRQIKQETYDYDAQGNKQLSIYKEILFDTNGIMVLQTRQYYALTPSGQAQVYQKYVYDYNPKTQMGEYYNERIEHPARRNNNLGKEKTEFKSYDHQSKNLWVKQYDVSGKLIRETRYTYDNKGNMTSSYASDKVLQVVRIDEVKRNAAGNMLLWESYDEDERGRNKVREMEYRYLPNDTSLLYSKGYTFTNWSEIRHEYNKKGQLLKISNFNGIYSPQKTKIDDKTITTYKDGRPVQIQRSSLGKKIATHQFRYEPGFIEETIIEGKNKTVVSTKEVYQDSLLTQRKIFRNNKPEYALHYLYHQGKLQRKTETEYKTNGDVWETIIEYNEKGNPISRRFSINNKPRQEDLYRYEYHTQP
jgi:hypothetical protein